jgi:acyl-coenzyme A thioesterase PaaI-like protein
MNLTQLHRIRQTAIDQNWKEMESFFNASIQLRHSGIRVDLTDISKPLVIIDEVQEYHKGGVGTEAVNGAVIAMLADLAIGLLGLSHYADGMTATSNLSINYIKPLMAKKVTVQAEATEVVGKRIFGIVRVMNETGEVCSYATGSLAKGIIVG